MLSLIYVGTSFCGNCRNFKKDWAEIKDKLPSSGLPIEVVEYVVDDHAALPPALEQTVTFYPFLMLTPKKYFEENLNTTDRNFILEGEVMYAVKSYIYEQTTGKRMLKYEVGRSVSDSPSMRYPRTTAGVMEWLKDVAIPALESMINTGKYENYEIIIRMSGLKTMVSQDSLCSMEANCRDVFEGLQIPSLNKEYSLASNGMVLCRRIRSIKS